MLKQWWGLCLQSMLSAAHISYFTTHDSTDWPRSGYHYMWKSVLLGLKPYKYHTGPVMVW